MAARGPVAAVLAGRAGRVPPGVGILALPPACPCAAARWPTGVALGATLRAPGRLAAACPLLARVRAAWMRRLERPDRMPARAVVMPPALRGSVTAMRRTADIARADSMPGTTMHSRKT